MMELKNWLKQSTNKVQMMEDVQISKITFDFIQPPTEEEKLRVAQYLKNEIDRIFTLVIESMAEKEGRKGDIKTI
jgi:hypothetical protein